MNKPHAHAPNADAAALDALQQQAWQRLIEPVARLAAPQTEAPPRNAGDTGLEADGWAPHRLRFLQAGLRARAAPVLFYAGKVALAAGLPLGAWALLWALGRPVHGSWGWGALVMSAAVGHYAPQVWLAARIRERQRTLFEAFPDAVDLMIVCVEAGLGLDAALDRAGREIALRCPALAEEFELVGAELRLGAGRAQALRRMGLRTGVQEIQQFVAMLVQAERFGIGVADAMRVHAQALRLRRQLRAEEEASKIGLKLLFPLIFTLFPALMVVLLGPAGISLARQMMPLVGGG